MKLADARIKGLTALLQHRFSEASEASVGRSTRKSLVQSRTPREEAEQVCYRNDEGTLYFPSSSILRLLREVGSGHKMRGTRKSLKYIVPGAVFLLDDTFDLIDPEEGKKLIDFEVDSRPVVIPSTKGRIMRHRPRLDEWAAEFSLEIDDEVMSTDDVNMLLTEGGRKIGLGDFRPEKGGPFGRFIVENWHVRKSLD